MGKEQIGDSTFATIIGLTASTISIFFFISPIILFLEARKTKKLYKIPILMLIANTLNNTFWIFYGFSKHQFSQWLCNVIAIAFNVTWILWYSSLYFKDNVYKVCCMAITLCLLAVVIAFGVFLDYNPGWQDPLTDVIGYCATVMNIVMYAGPGQNLVKVFKTGNYLLIPIWSSVIGWISSILWLFYTFIDHTAVSTNSVDWPPFIPNAFGVVIMPIQIIVWFYYYRKAKSEGKSYDLDDNEDNDYEGKQTFDA